MRYKERTSLGFLETDRVLCLSHSPVLTVYFPCCQRYRANTNDLEVSYTLFLVYYNQLLITQGLIMYSVNWFLFPTVVWNMVL